MNDAEHDCDTSYVYIDRTVKALGGIIEAEGLKDREFQNGGIVEGIGDIKPFVPIDVIVIESKGDNIIKEMEKKISQYEEERISLLNKIDRKDAEIKASEQIGIMQQDQICRMKCCMNCKHQDFIGCEIYENYTENICDKWEMRE